MLNHFDFLAPFYDRLIASPDLGRWRELLELPTTGRLLDAGGGTGRVSAQLRPLVGQLVISDASQRMLAQAQIKDRIGSVLAKVERLPFPKEAFDRVMVVDALHHFDDQRQAVAELLRVTRPGGRLVIEEPDVNRLPIKFVALAEKLMLMRSHFYSPAAIAHMVADHGFAPHIEGDGRFTAWIVVDK